MILFFKAETQIVDLEHLFSANYCLNYAQAELYASCLAIYNICYANNNRKYCFPHNLPKTH